MNREYTFTEDDGDTISVFVDDHTVTIGSSVDHDSVCMLQSTWQRIVACEALQKATHALSVEKDT